MIGAMRPRTPPVLETPRLILRGWRHRDLEAHAEMSADPEVMRFIGDGLVHDRGQSWREIATHIGHWALRGYGQWALERKEDGASLGRAGLWNPPGWPGLEVGWKLARHAWGHGYATEAGAAAIEWAWATLDAPRLISVIQPENARSIRVAERLGMRQLREATLQGQPVTIFALDRP
jgi:RimJ/RimL family protein N-acetyltransferase